MLGQVLKRGKKYINEPMAYASLILPYYSMAVARLGKRWTLPVALVVSQEYCLADGLHFFCRGGDFLLIAGVPAPVCTITAHNKIIFTL